MAPPILSCPGPLTIAAGDQCTAFVPDLISQVTASDNCTPVGSLVISQSPEAGTLAGLGAATITVTATDAAGNSGTCTTTVTVVDATSPAVSCPAVVTVPADADCQAPVPDVLASVTATDNCTQVGSLTLTQSPAAGTLVGVGPTLITVTATDTEGNSGTCTTTLTVVDETPPTIILMGANTLVVECHAPFADPGATAIDLCAGSVAVNSSGAVDRGTPGSYTITYSATDLSGNTATATRTVHVVDMAAPVITLNGANPLTVPCRTPFTDPGATASDACADSLAVEVSGSVDVNTPGDYILTYTASDPSGNTTSATRTVTVTACPPFFLTCRSDLTVPNDAGLCSAIVNYPDPVPTGGVGSVTIVCNPPSGSVFPAGETIVNCTASDEAAQTANCSFKVILTDTVQPVITCPTDLTVQCLSDVPPPDFAGGRAIDNCDPLPAVTHLGDVAVGTNPILITRTYQATDATGNSATCIQIITVQGLAGDLNGDCCVDPSDLDILLSRIRARSTDLTYDLNGNGKVDIADARTLVLHFTNPGGSPCNQRE